MIEDIINEKALKHLKLNYEQALKAVLFNKTDYGYNIDFNCQGKNGFNDFIKVFNKQKKLKQIIKEFEVFYIFTEKVFAIYDTVKDDNIDEFYNNSNIVKASDELINLIQSLPNKYSFTFQLPIKIPKEYLPIKLTDEISIVDDQGYFSIKYNSYGYNAHAMEQANYRFKKFLYLSMSKFLNMNYINKPINTEFYYHSKNDESINKNFISSEIKDCVSRLRFENIFFDTKSHNSTDPNYLESNNDLVISVQDTKLKHFKEIIIMQSKCFIDIENSESKKSHIEAAIEWGFNAQLNRNQTFRFIQTCIGIESLIGSDSNAINLSITETLSLRASYIIGKGPKHRDEIRKKVREIYRIRSNLVHGKKFNLEEEENKLLNYAETILRTLIEKEIECINN